MSGVARGSFSATIMITDDMDGTMYRYDGGQWIEICEPGIKGTWEPLVYVWDQENDQAMIDMTIEDVAVALLNFLYQIEDEA